MKKFLLILVIITTILSSACAKGPFDAYKDDTKFLLKYGFSPEKKAQYFDVSIPSDWHISPNDMPIGLYWSEVNFLSKDIGYNIEKYKGKDVKAVIYRLNEKLSGKGENSKHSYPTNAVILRDGENIVGAWLEFNASTPLSLKKNYIEDLTEKPWIEWVNANGFLKDLSSPDADKLTPQELIYAFFNGINKGDTKAIYSTLSINMLHNMLYINRKNNTLYNTSFDPYSIEMNTKSAVVNKIEENTNWVPGKNMDVFESKEFLVNVDMKFKNEVGFKDGKNALFIIVAKVTKDSPWKIYGIGTGP
ncbi:DUF4829 domain-containing protein [Thermoanaerobacterium sp. RBIITD]|uniref:DUF4829 domain-containing protein n=1 Tax=Thermoanaerobacterium sp. RBIITD TaxID=1550240 RepID=UPI000BB86BBB|nr:DUF4829 domain-containing protein [Thermoanaerobacterium sp. RBIITD]SNX53609.1 protein of unknown function [Thermoanaerobacterium sp. RBIITD]